LAHLALVKKTDWILAVYQAPWRLLKPNTLWGGLLMLIAIKGVAAFAAVTMALTAPLTLLVLSMMYSVRLPLTSFALALAMGMLGFVRSEDAWMFLPLSFAFAVGLVCVQWLATRLSRSRWFKQSATN
jgi:hypothetical protein